VVWEGRLAANHVENSFSRSSFDWRDNFAAP
jgi:hypothetical protein